MAGILALSFIFKRKRKMKDKMIELAKAERDFWQNGKIKEGTPSHLPRLRQYWNAAGVRSWTDQRMIDEAWSAAFISYILKNAGAGSDFNYSTSHSVFWQSAKKNRADNNINPFKAYRILEAKPEPGDIIIKGRSAGITFDTPGYFKSHSDIVISVSPTQATVIGGNLSNSVRSYTVALKNGYIDNSKVTDGNPWIGIIKVNK